MWSRWRAPWSRAHVVVVGRIVVDVDVDAAVVDVVVVGLVVVVVAAGDDVVVLDVGELPEDDSTVIIAAESSHVSSPVQSGSNTPTMTW